MKDSLSGRIYLITIIAINVIVAFLIINFNFEGEYGQIFSIIFTQLSILLVLFLFSLRYKISIKNIFVEKINIKSPIAYLMIPLMSVALIFCFNDLNNVVIMLFEKMGLKGTEIIVFWDTPIKLFIVLCCVAVLPAIAEETFIRGYVLKGLSSFKAINAILLSALMFSLMHMNIMQFSYQFMLGVILALLVKLSGRLDYSILLHFFNNAIVIIYAYFYGADTEISLTSGYVIKSIALAALGVVIVTFIFYIIIKGLNAKNLNKSLFSTSLKQDISFYKNTLEAPPAMSKIESNRSTLYICVAIIAVIWVLNLILMSVGA